MSLKKLTALVLAAALALAGCASTPKKKSNIIAYEDMEGTIYQIPQADKFLIKTGLGNVVVVEVTDDTEFKKDGDDSKFKEFKENDSVKIHGNTDPENHVFVAVSVETGEAKGKSDSFTSPTDTGPNGMLPGQHH